MAFNKSALVAWREWIGASQTDAARILGITQPYLSEPGNRARKSPVSRWQRGLPRSLESP